MPHPNPEYQKGYQAGWIAGKRAFFFSDKKCVECGSDKNLELDHVDREKKWTHRIWSRNSAAMAMELKKCQVLCKECHFRKTAVENGKKEHSLSAYKRGCRCDICKAYRAADARKYRSRPVSLVGKRLPVTQVSGIRFPHGPPKKEARLRRYEVRSGLQIL